MRNLSGRTCRAAVFAAALGVSGTALAQAPGWQIGTHALATAGPGAEPLRERAAGPGGLLSRRYLLEIGGVDFEAVASPAGQGTAPISLSYDAAAPDGQRLVVRAGATVVRPELPDWELKPITALADSPYTADVSLFGDGPDTDHYVYPRFHPALRNTLLGMRLLQADLMLSHPESYRQVPALGGAPVLGAGETMPDEAASRHAAQVLEGVMGSYEFQSWVLTDIGRDASIGEGGAETDLQPFYYFWSTRIGAAALHLLRLTSLESLVSKDEQKSIRPQVEAAARRFEALERSEAANEDPRAMPDLTSRIAADAAMVRALNPLVWRAVENTARTAALFRLVKRQDPQGWSGFAAAVQKVRVVPEVPTPTSWAREE